MEGGTSSYGDSPVFIDTKENKLDIQTRHAVVPGPVDDRVHTKLSLEADSRSTRKH